MVKSDKVLFEVGNFQLLKDRFKKDDGSLSEMFVILKRVPRGDGRFVVRRLWIRKNQVMDLIDLLVPFSSEV